MRVYDTEIKHEEPGGVVEISEYHDERDGWVGPRRWHARIVVIDDTGIDVININRDTQQEVYQALERIEGIFETAKTAVLDAANVS